MLQNSKAEERNKEKLFFCIKPPFLEHKNYKVVFENSIKLNKTYENFCQTIQNYFKAFQQYCSHIKQPSQQKITFLYYFQKYLYDYSKIMSRITDYQISCFQAIKDTNKNNQLSLALHQIIEDTKKYAPFQKQIMLKAENLTNEFMMIKTQFMALQKRMKKPKYFYYRKFMRSEFQGLKSKISANQKAQQAIVSELSEIDGNTSSYLKQLIRFRKQLLKNKYRQQKKFTDLGLNSQQSLGQLFFYQYNCLKEYYEKILSTMNKQDDQFSMLKSQKSFKATYSDANTCINSIVKNTEDFLSLLQSIQNDIRTTEKNFYLINQRLKSYRNKSIQKHLLQSLNQCFDIQQSPAYLILDTINTFEFCFRKLADKQISWKQAAEDIKAIRNDVVKHKGITISLLKVRPLSKTFTLNSMSNKSTQLTDQYGVYELLNSLDLIPVKAVIKNALDKLLHTLEEISQYFNQRTKLSRKLKNVDSMELSYIQKSFIEIKKKRPAKDELWLWDDYRKRVDTEFRLSKQLFNQIMRLFEQFKDNGEMELNVERYECYCEQIQELGELCLSKKMVQFQSRVSQRQLTIPVADIEQIKRKKTVIKDSIHIKTKRGELVFRQFTQTSQIQETLKEALQNNGTQNQLKINKKIKVELTQQQKTVLDSEQRKLALKNIRPDVKEFQQIHTEVFESLTIDQFYFFILSDQKFTLSGKENQSFLVYVMKKLKNIDFKITSFQPPGPYFYTLNSNVTFQNGPLFSECSYQYNHILDMPFLPSQCNNKQQRKIYWINDKQLDYFIHAQTYGIAMSENFYVEIIYKIREQNNNTILKVYAQIKFLKSFALKEVVQRGTWKQIKEGTASTMKEMQKGANLFKNLQNGKLVQQEKQQSSESSNNKQIQRLRKKYNFMIITVVIVILANLILKFIF